MTDTQREKRNRWMEAGGELPEEAGKCSQGIKRKMKKLQGL